MDLSAGGIFTSLVVGSVGFSLYLYGKKALRWPQLVTGLVLMVFPVFVPDALGQLVIAAALLLGMWALIAAGK